MRLSTLGWVALLLSTATMSHSQTFIGNADASVNEYVGSGFFINYTASDHKSQPTPVLSSTAVNRRDGQSSAKAGAGPGYLTTFAEAHSQLSQTQQPTGANASATGEAQFSLYDVIISSPVDTRIDTKLNLNLNGTMVANAFGFQPGQDISTIEVVVYYTGYGQELYSNGSIQLVDQNGTKTQSSQGALAGGLGDIQLDMFGVQTNTPLPEFRVLLRASASATQGIGDAITDAYHTLTFNTHGQVFTLPTGYTANSVQGGIVNNGYISPLQNTTPEPGALALLIGMSITGTGFLARRKCVRLGKAA